MKSVCPKFKNQFCSFRFMHDSQGKKHECFTDTEKRANSAGSESVSLDVSQPLLHTSRSALTYDPLLEKGR